ncbi:MAG: hypothetical protein WC869_11685 [Phycisphaerae bacterium]|jgi:hypothetical protein
MANLATNPQTGETVFYDGKSWQPAKIAENPQTGERVAWDGQAWKPLKGQADMTADAVGAAVKGAGRPAETSVDNMLANFLQGATFGYGDEIVAGGRDLFGLENYDQALAGHRGLVKEGQDASPTGAFLANLAGGLAVPGIGFGKAMQAGTALGKFGGLAAAGAATGGLTGFGLGEGGFDNRLGDAARGAAIGGIAAPVVVGTANVLGRGYDALMDVTGLGGAGRAETLANRKILQSLERVVKDPVTGAPLASGLGPDDALKAIEGMRATGSDPALAYLGEMPARQTASAARVPGKGAEIAADFVESQQAGQGSRMASVFEDVFGTNKSASSFLDDLNKTQKAAAKPLYAAADPVPLPLAQAVNIGTDEAPRMVALNDLMQFDDFKSALQRGIRISTLEDGAPKIAWDPASGTIPTRMVDLVKKGLDADIAAALRNDPVMARALIGFKKQLLAVVDNLNPKYGEARAVWAGAMELEDALTAGRKALGTAPEELGNIFRGLTPSQQPAFRVGIMDALKETISKSGDGRNKVLALFGSPRARAQLEAVLGPDDFARLTQYMGIEKVASKVRGKISGGSITAERLADDSAQGKNPVDLLVSAIANPKGALGYLGRKAAGYTRGLNEKTAANIVGKMTETDPAKLRGIIDLLKEFGVKDAARMANPLRQGMTYGVGVGGVAAPMGLLNN